MASFRKIGSVWQYRVRFKRKDADEWMEVSKSGFKTKKEAQLAAAKKERELLNGIEQGEMNFAFYMNEWLAQYVKDKKRPNTYRTYRNAIEKHAIPRFGHMDLKDVKPMMYQKFIDSKIEEGLSTETARRIHNAVYQAYKRAVINGYLEKNPCEYVQISKREVKRLKYLEPELVPLFFKEAYKRSHIYELFFRMLFETCMRKGEAAALQWSDINWKDGTIHIQRSLDFQPEEVLLFISDGLKDITNSIFSVYPDNRYQTCLVHLARMVVYKVRVTDRAKICGDFNHPSYYALLISMYYFTNPSV